MLAECTSGAKAWTRFLTTDRHDWSRALPKTRRVQSSSDSG